MFKDFSVSMDEYYEDLKASARLAATIHNGEQHEKIDEDYFMERALEYFNLLTIKNNDISKTLLKNIIKSDIEKFDSKDLFASVLVLDVLNYSLKFPNELEKSYCQISKSLKNMAT